MLWAASFKWVPVRFLGGSVGKGNFALFYLLLLSSLLILREIDIFARQILFWGENFFGETKVILQEKYTFCETNLILQQKYIFFARQICLHGKLIARCRALLAEPSSTSPSLRFELFFFRPTFNFQRNLKVFFLLNFTCIPLGFQSITILIIFCTVNRYFRLSWPPPTIDFGKFYLSALALPQCAVSYSFE